MTEMNFRLTSFNQHTGKFNRRASGVFIDELAMLEAPMVLLWITKAITNMIVDHATCLHKGITNSAAYKFETTLF